MVVDLPVGSGAITCGKVGGGGAGSSRLGGISFTLVTAEDFPRIQTRSSIAS